MTEQRKPDLSQIEPIGKAPDADDQPAASSGTPVAVGTDDAVVHREGVDRETEPRTSPETEEELERLRRG
jgi:hypothetical protein